MSNSELANIYGQKRTELTTLDGATVETYESRRQARKARRKEAESMGLQTYQLRLVAIEQSPDARRRKQDVKENGQQPNVKKKSTNRPKPGSQKHDRSAKRGRTTTDEGRDRRPERGQHTTDQVVV